jgi:hypothetical protein
MMILNLMIPMTTLLLLVVGSHASDLTSRKQQQQHHDHHHRHCHYDRQRRHFLPTKKNLKGASVYPTPPDLLLLPGPGTGKVEKKKSQMMAAIGPLRSTYSSMMAVFLGVVLYF